MKDKIKNNPREFYLYGTSEKYNTVIGFCEINNTNNYLDLLHVIEAAPVLRELEAARKVLEKYKCVADRTQKGPTYYSIAEQAINRIDEFVKGLDE